MSRVDAGTPDSGLYTGSYIGSVGRAAAVLRCFSSSKGPLGVSELARLTGLTTSTAHRVLYTLLVEGLVSREEGTERYMPGPVLLALAHNAFVSGGFPSALQVLADLAGTTRESSSLGVRRDTCVVVLLQSLSPEPLRFEEQAGTLVPIHTTALGKALLAFGPTSVDEAVFALGPLARPTSQTLVGEALCSDLVAAGERGYTVAHEEQVPGVSSVSAPLVGPDGARAAVGVQGPTVRFTAQRIPVLGEAVLRAAEAMQLLPMSSQLSRMAITP
jgi:IclR family transcriptional regulator, acetate operon repressor